MTREQARDLAERAAWTFLQAFLAAWALTGFSFTKAAFIGAAAGGISALKTFVKETM